MVGGALIAALLLGAIGCRSDGATGASGSATTDGAGPPTTVTDQLVSGDLAALLDADGRSLTFHFTGGPSIESPADGCQVGYVADAEETQPELRVRIRTTAPILPADAPEVGCTLVGYDRTATLDLGDPLGDRRLVNAADDRTVGIFDGSTLAVPSWLPDGFTLLHDGGGIRGEGGGVSWAQTWGEAVPAAPPTDRCRPGAGFVMLDQGPPPEPPPYPVGQPPVVGTTTVHGQPADQTQERNGVTGAVAANHLTWTEGATLFALTSGASCDGDTPLGFDVLQRIADGLT